MHLFFIFFIMIQNATDKEVTEAIEDIFSKNTGRWFSSNIIRAALYSKGFRLSEDKVNELLYNIYIASEDDMTITYRRDITLNRYRCVLGVGYPGRY